MREDINTENLLYDERSAGGIAYRMENGSIEWLLIKTSGNNKADKSYVFKFPKGHLQKNEFLKQAALREVEEEGRIKAKIVDKIGSNNYVIFDKLKNKKIVKKVTFFLMEYTGPSNSKYYDMELVLDRVWVNFEDATKMLAYESERVLLQKARAKLEALLKDQKAVK